MKAHSVLSKTCLGKTFLGHPGTSLNQRQGKLAVGTPEGIRAIKEITEVSFQADSCCSAWNNASLWSASSKETPWHETKAAFRDVSLVHVRMRWLPAAAVRTKASWSCSVSFTSNFCYLRMKRKDEVWSLAPSCLFVLCLCCFFPLSPVVE